MHVYVQCIYACIHLKKNKAMLLGDDCYPPKNHRLVLKNPQRRVWKLPFELVMGVQENLKTTQAVAVALGYDPEFEGKMPYASDTGLEGIHLNLTWEDPS